MSLVRYYDIPISLKAKTSIRHQQKQREIFIFKRF